MIIKRSSDRDRSIPIVRYRPVARQGEALAPRGSIVVYLAAADSKALATLYKAAREGKGVSNRAVADADTVPRQAAAKVTLLHGSKVLAAKVPVPADGTAVRLILPYNGGALAPEGLIVREDGATDTPKVEAIAVLHAPSLSRIEQAAVDFVPYDKLVLNVGAALPGGIAGLNDDERRRQEEERRRQEEAAEARQEAAVARAEAMAEVAAERAAKGSWWSPAEMHFMETTVESLGNVATAGALVELRRNAMIQE